MKDIVELKINKPKLSLFVKEAGKIALRKEAGESLLKITEAIDTLQAGLERVKDIIRSEGIREFGVVPSVYYKNLSVYEKEVGEKYTTTNPLFSKKTERVFADSKKIEEYLKKEGKLPENTTSNIRKKTVVIQKKEK